MLNTFSFYTNKHNTDYYFFKQVLVRPIKVINIVITKKQPPNNILINNLYATQLNHDEF